MNIRLLQIIGAVLIISTFTGCAAPALADQTGNKERFSLARLPAVGYIDLDPVDEVKLESLGLSPEPWNGPPLLPFNQYGVYWSRQLQMYEGDTLIVKVTSDTPVSWFGVDWKILNLRGIVAKFDLDEDGHTFDAQYPENSSVSMVDGKYVLSVKYKFDDDAKCVLLVKNNSVDTPWRVLVNVNKSFNFSFEKILKKLGLKRLDDNTSGDPDG